MRVGKTDLVRFVWVGSIHRCVGVHEDMATVANMKHNSSEHHVK